MIKYYISYQDLSRLCLHNELCTFDFILLSNFYVAVSNIYVIQNDYIK